MARRRMIDPNIWASEDMAKLTIRQRLLVIGLFSNSDDHGKGKAKPTYVRSTIFPYDDVPIDDVIADLEIINVTISIEFYVVENNSYYRFTKWNKWQTVQKPQPSLIPDPVENHSLPSIDPIPPKGKERKGKEEKGREPEILPLINLHKINYDKDEQITYVESYLNTMDFEVIEDTITRSNGKHINYLLKTLKNLMSEGKTKKESLSPKFVSPTEQEAINAQRRADELKNQTPLTYSSEFSEVDHAIV
jgi:hypothetical protein